MNFGPLLPSLGRATNLLLLSLAWTAPALAQAPAKSADESPVILSPFEVNTQRDTGFVASSSLAGGRLAGELKDTPIAYSVLTRDFIDALQLVDFTEMAQWTPNSYEIPDNGDQYGTGGQIFLASRGVGSNSPQRNFFPINYNFDSYNLERLDFARGPNAVLFGGSGVGGTAISMTKRARTDRFSMEQRLTYDSWSSIRSTLDVNLPVSPRLAFRVNGLFDDRKGWRDSEVQKRTGITLAATWKPWQTTEIRAEAETGRHDKSVITTNFDDNISGWNGTSTFSAPIAAAIAAAGINRYAARINVFTPSNGDGILLNYEGWAQTQGGGATATTPASGATIVGTSANIVGAPIAPQVNLPATLYDRAVNGSRFRIPSRERSTFPDVPLYSTGIQNFTLSLTQQLGQHFFAEVAGNYSQEDVSSDIAISRNLADVYIDVNSVLPDGRPNPNFLQPYGETFSYPYRQFRDRWSGRAALGFVTGRTRWGEYSFNTLLGFSDNRNDRNAYRYMLLTNADPRQWPTNTSVRFRYYLNTDTRRPMPMPSSWTLVDPVTRTTSTVRAASVRDYTNTGFNQLNETDYLYWQSAANAKLFHGRLNLIGAARRDGYKTHQDSIVLQFDNPLDWNGTTRNLKAPAPSDWATLTYRARDTAGNPVGAVIPADTRPRLSNNQRNPIYAADRFRDDYSPPDTKDYVDTLSVGSVIHATKLLSFFANYAQSFVPPSAALSIDGDLFPPQLSDGWDAGLRVTLLGGNFVANVTRYGGHEENRGISAGGFATGFQAIINANALTDLTNNGRNQRGLLPLPLGYSDSTEVKTKGWELEITANLSRDWRVMLNGALPESYQTNPTKDSLAYFTKNRDTLRQIVSDAGGTFVGDVASFTATIPPGQSATEGPAAVAAWNTIIALRSSIVSEPQKLTRLTEGLGNVFMDYSFRQGWLKGIRIGGGFNYRGRQVIGYKGADTIRHPANPLQAIDDPAVGALDAVYQPGYTVATATCSYRTRLGDKLALVIDLKVANLFDYDQPLYFNTIMRPPGGDLGNPARVNTPYRFSWITPRNYTVTATVKF